MKKILKIYKKIITLYKWISIVYNDYDYDYNSIYDILDFKLKKMLKFYLSDNVYQTDMTLKPIISQIKLAISLLDKIRDRYYELEIYDYIEESNDFIMCDDKKSFKMESKLIREDLDSYFKKYHIICDIKNFESKKRFAIKIADKKQEKCRRLFFKLLNEKIEQWWD